MTGEDRVAVAIVSGLDRGRWFRGVESGANACQLGGAAGVCQEAEVTDATEALGQCVEQKATDELVGGERHHLAPVVGAIVLPAETDTAILAGEQTAVGDRDAMGVAPQIVEHLLRSGERTFGIDDPFEIAQRRQMAGERRRFAQAGESAEELQLAALERRLQALQEQASV